METLTSYVYGSYTYVSSALFYYLGYTAESVKDDSLEANVRLNEKRRRRNSSDEEIGGGVGGASYASSIGSRQSSFIIGDDDDETTDDDEDGYGSYNVVNAKSNSHVTIFHSNDHNSINTDTCISDTHKTDLDSIVNVVDGQSVLTDDYTDGTKNGSMNEGDDSMSDRSNSKPTHKMTVSQLQNHLQINPHTLVPGYRPTIKRKSVHNSVDSDDKNINNNKHSNNTTTSIVMKRDEIRADSNIVSGVRNRQQQQAIETTTAAAMGKLILVNPRPPPSTVVVVDVGAESSNDDSGWCTGATAVVHLDHSAAKRKSKVGKNRRQHLVRR